MLTPYASPKKVTSEKHITAINNVGKKLSISKRTFSEISRLSFSPTITTDSNLSPAVSSSSTSTTPKKYLNNAGANLPTYVATPIISDAKCSLKRRYYTTYSSSSSPWTTPDASPKKCLVPALPISVSANLPSVGFTNTTNSTSTPDVSSENILFKHISPLKNLPSTTALSTVFNPSLNSSSQETEVNCNSFILISSFPTNSFNSINHTKSTYNKISEYFPDSTGEFLGESTVGEQNRSVDQLVENPLKLVQIKVPFRNQKSKKHFCIFCKTLQMKLARHFFLKHKSEKQIKEILHLPSRSNYRLKVIDDLRKKGDFLHNTSEERNIGILIVTRQQQEKRKNEPDDYVCCTNCKGFYSKNTIRIHLPKCAKGVKNARDNLISGRKMTQYIHSAANFTIRTKIFPVLRNDDITKAIRYDELIIKY
ncbi:hypothetical protein CVS40_12958 [Lucilia cuprina]|nr:hypothetical protein CVS40_12958 [Lucilia cuprina]